MKRLVRNVITQSDRYAEGYLEDVSGLINVLENSAYDVNQTLAANAGDAFEWFPEGVETKTFPEDLPGLDNVQAAWTNKPAEFPVSSEVARSREYLRFTNGHLLRHAGTRFDVARPRACLPLSIPAPRARVRH